MAPPDDCDFVYTPGCEAEEADCSPQEAAVEKANEAITEHCPALTVACVRAAYNLRYTVKALLDCQGKG